MVETKMEHKEQTYARGKHPQVPSVALRCLFFCTGALRGCDLGRGTQPYRENNTVEVWCQEPWYGFLRSSVERENILVAPRITLLCIPRQQWHQNAEMCPTLQETRKAGVQFKKLKMRGELSLSHQPSLVAARL